MVRSCKSLGMESQVAATARLNYTLTVNGKGELYITSGPYHLSSIYRDIAPKPQSTLRLIFSQATTNCILQISTNYSHAAFVTETRQVFTFGHNSYYYCGIGNRWSDLDISKPTLVTALEMIPCQQVMVEDYFTKALTRSGALYSWGYSGEGQLGHGHIDNESEPREVIVEKNNGAQDPVVQVSTTSWHVVAVTKVGQLFTWGSGWHGCLGYNNSCNKLWPKQIKHGRFAELFIVCAYAGHYCSAAIDSSGLVYIWGHNYVGYACTLQLIDSLKAYCAIRVVAMGSIFVILNNGQVCKIHSIDHFDKERSMSFIIRGHKIQSITLGYNHGVMVTMKGAIFGFGRNNNHQLGVVDPSALLGDTISTLTEVFAKVIQKNCQTTQW